MMFIQLACYFLLTTLCQVMCAIQTCGCGTQTCTNIQVGHDTYIPDNCNDQSPMSESSCYNKLTLPNVWIVNYRPDKQACRISECDTTPGMRRSIYGLIMYRKTCQTGCLNYTLEKYTNCWTQPSAPAVLAQQYITSSEEECLRSCLPPIKSCMVVYDSSSDECDVFENVDTSALSPCIQTGSSQTTYYVACYDNVQVHLCGIPVAISFGNVTYTDMSVSSTATYYCEMGYELIGTATVTCQVDLQWSTPIPDCQIVDCNAPPTVAYSVVSPADLSATSLSTVYGSSVTYSCETGYNLSGTTTISCLDSGAWGSPLPSCQIVDCNEPPTVAFAVVSPSDPLALSLLTEYGSSVTYSCETGYTLSGTPHVSCLDSGAWESPLPSCQLVDCNDPPNVTHATVVAMTTTYNSTATYICAAQYTIVGTATVSCLDDGQWGPSVPSCSLVDCQAPPNVTNATASFTGTTFGSYATYTCFTSQTRVGPPTIACQDDGSWTQPMVLCVPKGNAANTPPRPLYITSCACSTGSSFINMTEDEIIALLIADTEINSKETTLSQYSLKCRSDNRTSSLITGIVGISVLSIIFGTMLCLDLLTLCRYFKRNSAE